MTPSELINIGLQIKSKEQIKAEAEEWLELAEQENNFERVDYWAEVLELLDKTVS